MDGGVGGGRNRKRGVERDWGDNKNKILIIDTAPFNLWICLLDVLYTPHALVLFRVRGLDVKVRFALGAFGANGNEQIACLMAPTLSKTHIFST